MKIGVFDSGLGGLIVTKAFLSLLGDYDYVYLGDTKNLPYGNKTSKEVLDLTIKGMEFLIEQGALLIVIACNTASCVALRYLQRVYMPRHHPKVKVLGVIVPTVEEAIGSQSCAIGVAATTSTVSSHIYKAEIQKIAPEISVLELATPELVPLIESGNRVEAETWVARYVDQFMRGSTDHKAISSLILGCTHYPMLKELFRKYLPPEVRLISQDEFMGQKLSDYLRRHQEIESRLAKNGQRDFFVSEMVEGNIAGARKILAGIELKLMS